MIEKKQLIISIIFNGVNIPFFIYYIYDSAMHQINFLHITRWSYYLNSIFTTICLICDIMIYISEKEESNIESDMNYKLMIDNDNKKKKELAQNKIKILDDWNKNKFGNVCNSLGYFVSVGFWCLFFFGNNMMQISKSIKSVFNCIYHHCIIQTIVIINIFNSDRKKHYFSWIYFGIIFSIFLFYCTVIYIEKYFLKKNAYYFMDNKSSLFLFFCFIFSSIFLFLSYLLNIFIIEIKEHFMLKNNGKFKKENDESIIKKDLENNLLEY